MKWKQKHERCKRGHLRTPENLYAGGACRQCSLDCQKRLMEAVEDPVAFRRSRWLRNYGQTPESYEAQLLHQGGRCAACFVTLGTSHITKPVIDHKHGHCKTKRACPECIRGILCLRCNLVLGYLENEPNLLPEFLVRYLRSKIWISKN